MVNPYVALSVSKITRILEELNYANLADLLADAMHYADHHKLDWHEEIDRAHGYVESDKEEEE